MEHIGSAIRTPETPPPFDHRVRCPACNGAGEHLEPDERAIGNPDALDPGLDEVPCARCDGTGALDLDEAIDRGFA